MKTLASFGIVLIIMALFFINISNNEKANELKLPFLIHTTSFWDITYYTNNYTIDSLGCIHFINQDSVPMIICGTYVIKPNEISKEEK